MNLNYPPTITLTIDDGKGTKQTFLVSAATLSMERKCNPIFSMLNNDVQEYLPQNTTISFTGTIISQFSDKAVAVKTLEERKEEFEGVDRMDEIG
jgi:hypothetical protein